MIVFGANPPNKEKIRATLNGSWLREDKLSLHLENQVRDR